MLYILKSRDFLASRFGKVKHYPWSLVTAKAEAYAIIVETRINLSSSNLPWYFARILSPKTGMHLSAE